MQVLALRGENKDRLSHGGTDDYSHGQGPRQGEPRSRWDEASGRGQCRWNDRHE